jgi:hypothetical protein
MGGRGGYESQLRPLPGDFLTMPANRITALMLDGQGTAEAVAELVEEGVPLEEIFVLCGPAGLQQLDVNGSHRSLRTRLFDLGHTYGHTPDWLRERMSEHIESGGLAIVVPATEEAKPHVADILGKHGGFEMAHFGRAHWEALGAVAPPDGV